MRIYHESTDRPADLSAVEVEVYVRAYSKSCVTYAHKYGAPGVGGPAPAPGTAERRALGIRLSELAREHEAARHPAAHRAGMAAVRRLRKACAAMAAIETELRSAA